MKGTAEESAYLLEYEKQRIETCAKSFEELAKVFVYLPEHEKNEEGIETETSQDRKDALMKRRLLENRELFADNLREMAAIMGQVIKSDVRAVWFADKRKRQMIHILEEEGLLVQDIYQLEKNNGKVLFVVRLKCKKNVQATSEEVAGYLSVLVSRHLQPTAGMPFFIGQEEMTLYLEEEARFSVLSGYAKAVKETEKVSGDNYSFFETNSGYYMAILSDGMGSGEKACADSEAVVDMAEKLMDAGFSLETTVQMINDALLAGAENTNMSTLDLCGVDLYEGVATFAKIGSACTYIKNGEIVEKLSSSTLPLGVFHRQDVELHKRKLHDGDYIVMFSDGVMDCISGENGEEFMQELISQLQFERPNEIANCIMKYVLNLSKGRIRDDMTVLVMGFWENKWETC
ncbi:MAG: SpoIIE family protein phosphatase [Lachnospiraceae bacterium]|nr:SpoIIE family protein phosphatase [Lachnospiraceae bacterium]